MLNPDKLLADSFEFIGSIVAKIQENNKPRTPDVSDIPIDHLISEAEIADPELLYHRDDTVPDIDFKLSAKLPFIEIHDGTFTSPLKTSFPETNTVHVKHYRLTNGRPNRPTVLMINGLNLDSNFYFDWWCWRFAAWGLDTALLMMPFSQKRVPQGSYSGQYAVTARTEWTLLTMKHTFMDTQLFVNWLKAQSDGLVGTFGVSFGALVSGIYICRADNADFTVLGMPPVNVVEIFNMWDFADDLRARGARGEKTLLSDPRVPPICNMMKMMPKIPTDKIFIAKGLYDHLVSPESIDATVDAWGGGGGLKWLREYPTGHLNTFVLNLRFINDVKKFINEEVL